MTEINYDNKQKLACLIEKIRDKKKLIEICTIIKKYNANIIMTENDNGIFLNFSNLSDITYLELDTFLKKCKKSTTSEHSESFKLNYTPYSQDDSFYDQSVAAKLKLSNKEKTLIKKKLYDSAIKANNSDS